MKRYSRRALAQRIWGAAMIAAMAGAAPAQTVQDDSVPDTGLDLPANLQIFGKVDPNVRKPTAIVNNTVVTGTDIDQRLALYALLNDVRIDPAERDQFRLAMLRQLIDETLEIQEAKTAKVEITSDKITQAYAKIADRFGKTSAQLTADLRKAGSSERSLRRQIEGELAWQGYLQNRIEPFVSVGDEEVNSILQGLKEAQGTEEYNLREIFLSTNGSNNQQVEADAHQLMAAIQKGDRPFGTFARAFSEASTKAQDGDLGWVRGARLPAELAQAVKEIQPGQVAGPIQLPGGYSIIYLADKRRVLASDPRDARLSLKQVTVHFPAGLTDAQTEARVNEVGQAFQRIHGCGSVAAIAQQLGADVVDNDTVHIRDLPPALQDIMLKMQVGEVTPPFRAGEPGLRALVMCGRDDPAPNQLPGSDQIQNQLAEQRVNLRAQQKLRDLRRDAVIDYR